MDPETGVDAVRNVGTATGRLSILPSEALSGRPFIRAGGLVVAPGFIDLHQHGQDLASQRVKVLDGRHHGLGSWNSARPDVAQFFARQKKATR